MESVVFVLVTSFVAGMVGGVLATSIWLFGLRQYALRLNVRLTDLEDRYMSLKGRKMVEAKNKEKDWIDEALKSSQSPQVKQYDNDPR